MPSSFFKCYDCLFETIDFDIEGIDRLTEGYPCPICDSENTLLIVDL